YNISLVEKLDLNAIDHLIKQFKYFSEATNDLQSDSINIDNVLIIYDPVFEEAIVKVLYKYENILILDEKQKLEAFIV
ncbi:13131_t:CDS:2, partial [Gigaspora margarita]